jgi:hypothetical protein
VGGNTVSARTVNKVEGQVKTYIIWSGAICFSADEDEYVCGIWSSWEVYRFYDRVNLWNVGLPYPEREPPRGDEWTIIC